jgi:hypothetical protein
MTTTSTLNALAVTTGNLSTGTSTIGTLINTTLINYGLGAQWTINGGGNVTWTGSSISWNARIIILPVKRYEYSTDGFFDIFCPTSGTITYYNNLNVTTTVTCTESGIPMSGWEALYYEITPGQVVTSDQTKFRLVHFNNTTWNPTSNWILIAIFNNDLASLKWIPGNTCIPSGKIFYSDITNNWQINGTTNYIPKFNAANTLTSNSIIFDNGSSIGINTTTPTVALHVSGDNYTTGWTRVGNGILSETSAAYLQPNDAQHGNWKMSGNVVGGWNGLRFSQSEITIMAGEGATKKCGFHYGETVGWGMFVDENRNLFSPGDITAYWSDKRLKTNLRQLSHFDNVLTSLTGYTFNWNEKGQEFTQKTADYDEVGLIAQDVQAVIPQAVNINKAGASAEDEHSFDYLTINYDKIVPFLIEGYKSQRSEIHDLKSKVQRLEELVQQLIDK